MADEEIKEWCNTHNRPAEECKVKGGILLPCRKINCEEVGIEIYAEAVRSDSR